MTTSPRTYTTLRGSILPQPTKHTLDWLHIAMKLSPIEQIAKRLARRIPPDEQEEFLEDIAAVR